MSDTAAAFFAARLARGGEIRRLFLRNLALPASIGIHKAEREARQRLLINVELFLASQPDADDDIDRVLDYDQVRAGIGRLVEARHYNLQETLVEEIVALCFRHPGVLAVRVSTEKPDVYPDCDGVGYEVFRVAPGESSG
ncbi:MAG: dihydroneopterin aldolase [Reyranellaceae bacterium]